MPTLQNTEGLLRALDEAGVQFVVVGGVAAHVHGSQIYTADLDVLIPFSPDNTARVIAALAPLAAHFQRTNPPRPLPTDPMELAQFRNAYLDTSLGRLDLLGAMPPVGDFAAVAARAQTHRLFGRPALVVALPDLIAVKEGTGRPKDALVAAELRAVAARLAVVGPG
ncbi:MAG: hypothetical protein FJ100_07170 [Deltaproteobacteria bacterium]|nr:hypothetical protein [Deltaproteobacteria bacterium]